METIKDDAIKTKDNTLNEVNSIKKEINSNKKESEDLKSEIYKIRDESKKLLKEMREERKAQKQEGKTILTEMEKLQKVNDLFNRAWIEANKNNKEEAIKLYTEALEIDTNNIMSLNNRGLLYYDKYKETKNEEYFKKSLEDYNNVINIDENNIYALYNRGNLYSNKYRETKDEEYFTKALNDYNNILMIDNNDYGTYINISFLYLNHYEVNKEKNKESLTQAEKYLNEGLKLHPNNLELINNYGILLYFKYKENKTINDLTNSEIYLKKALNDSRIKEDIGETYYYLHLVYDEYAKLDENISGYSKEECENKSKEYLQNSKDLGFKHFMDK